jgi:hypothetical protein
MGIRIWDSSNPLAEEYVRGCTLFRERLIHQKTTDHYAEQETTKFFDPKPFMNCFDYIHTGNVALSQATQILYNDICNYRMYKLNTK